ncbi:MAG: caspase family protein [Pseudomonadota bacterium]
MLTNRLALLIGVSTYDHPTIADLPSSLLDVEEMKRVLSRHENGDKNFECIEITAGVGSGPVTAKRIREALKESFSTYDGELLIYFSGHGHLEFNGGYLVTQDGEPDHPGIYMSELIDGALKSSVRTVTMLIDCCNAGALGEGAQAMSTMRDGMTILGSSLADQASYVSPVGLSTFTGLVVGALEGGAANTRGHVNAASIYGYVDASLGEFGQRPIYKSHARRVAPLRRCNPQCEDSLLRQITDWFPDQYSKFPLSRKFEETAKEAEADKVAIFQLFKKLQVGGLIRPVDRNQLHLYFTAMNEEEIELTELGRFYHRLVVNENI